MVVSAPTVRAADNEAAEVTELAESVDAEEAEEENGDASDIVAVALVEEQYQGILDALSWVVAAASVSGGVALGLALGGAPWRRY